MFRAGFLRVLLVVVLMAEALVAVRFTQARGKTPTLAKLTGGADQPAQALTADDDSSSASSGSAVDDLPVQTTPTAAPPTPVLQTALRVLMVGNSYTMHNSLHLLLQRVAAAVEGGPQLTVDAVARGGFSLHNHLRKGEAMQRIRARHYTHVVLQGHSLSALDHPSELAADAERFKDAIDAAAGRTVFYATWARSPEVSLYRTHREVRSFAEMSARVSSVYFDLSSRLGAALAPVGSAFERSLVEQPKLTLWGSDGSHPSLAGSYMAALVLYGAITGVDPTETTYVPAGLRPTDAERLRAVASESLAANRRATATATAGATTTTAALRGPT